MLKIWIVCLIVLMVISIVIQLLRPVLKGRICERIILKTLTKLPSDNYKVISNVELKSGKETTQIDYIVVSIYGIFVIEMKNYKGLMTGSGKGKPITQNYNHVKALKKSLNLPTNYFIPLVVFLTKAEIRASTEKPVVYTLNLKKEIKSHKKEKINPKELGAIVEQIKELNK
ncbi:hypothetical protein M2454_001399 [Aequitasia blattaphilus]|uniref:NERD domain-containing protein n=1 Tax=Aequitasia blattaphilus TaxID=2949332 RepID=A0ABT1E7S0_9FIRM|nr:nuclease-related domain-containing protein [Aequitasia blattaphilus]MCP1101866.1 NERD domain-containing protein [Aequitasia blattaphilus]MCR8614506.1 NERD domain-containing protein [Aequitasia blattaphilus]